MQRPFFLMELYFVKEYLTISDLKAKKIPIKITGLNLPQSNSIAPWKVRNR